MSFRFPSSFSQPAKPTHVPASATTSRPINVAFAIAAAAGAAAVAAGVAASSRDPANPLLLDALNFFSENRSLPLWASLSLTDSSNSVVDSRTGVSFPSLLRDSQRLLGIGIRRKSVLGLKNIDVYAFGIAFSLFCFQFSFIRNKRKSLFFLFF